jgi:aryl-alcohol dehydrogenase-like predicted oxidoreductase
MLSGKYRRNEAPPPGTRLAGAPEERRREVFADKNFDRIEALEERTRDRGHTLLELAFAWLLARPTVASVIAGATKPEQVRANVAAASWQLTAGDLEEIDALIERVKTAG